MALRLQRLLSSVKRAWIAGILLQVYTKDPFRFRCVACRKQGRAERFPHRIIAIRGLVVVQRILNSHGLSPMFNGCMLLAFGRRNPPIDHVRRHAQHSLALFISPKLASGGNVSTSATNNSRSFSASATLPFAASASAREYLHSTCVHFPHGNLSTAGRS